MGEIFSYIVAPLVIFPPLGFFIVFTISKRLSRNARHSFHLAIDCSTILFIFSVDRFIFTIWHKSLFSLLLLGMIFIAISFVFIYWKTKQEIIYKAVLKGIWRVYFLVFTIAYFVLLIWGLVDRIAEFVASP